MTYLGRLLISVCAAFPLGAEPMVPGEGDIDWGARGVDFPKALQAWSRGEKWSDDDNFFIPRVRPKTRFRNEATQVNPDLGEENDKNLIFWAPINRQETNALPDGRYDSEVFPMWQYVTHYGDWSAPLGRLPGNFADVAHKNGVAVSTLAAVPWGNISPEWKGALQLLAKTDPDRIADFMEYYGVDGFGYNSEFTGGGTLACDLGEMHAEVVRRLRDTGRMPLTEFIWYDGTNEKGRVTFDMGLADHNDDIWGYGADEKASLFLNYHWNYDVTLQNSMRHASALGRSPLDLYCGVNMQGREPMDDGFGVWTLLKDYPFSIGLWGAHSQNMFFEGRGERGPQAEDRQRSYMLRVERWFTGGSRNPVTSPAVGNSLICAADNDGFFGMSRLMTARSSLKWDLSDEPFMSFFNLGNGKFFNYRGERCHDSEWYNIGIQDYLPTWRWWFAGRLLGRHPDDVPAKGLEAEFVWDDAWMGGSTVRVYGTCVNEYLHLFKTEFALRAEDVVTFRYKLVNGSADLFLTLTAKGDEETPVAEDRLKVLGKGDMSGAWVERRFRVGEAMPALVGRELALVALHFVGAEGLDMRLGEFSIVRGDATSERPETPVIERAEILHAGCEGVDAKIVFNMPGGKEGRVCYNADVKTSLFKLYAMERGKFPVLMGMTTSWAGMMCSAPLREGAGSAMRFGVSALSLDMSVESDVAWSDYMPVAGRYEVSEALAKSRDVLCPAEAFSVRYADPEHAPACWTLYDRLGRVTARALDSVCLDVEDGLAECGSYDLSVESGGTCRLLRAYIQVTPASAGQEPRVERLEVNGEEGDISLTGEDGPEVTLAYRVAGGEGAVSRGLRVGEKAVGFRASEAGITGRRPFSVSFWFKADSFANRASHLFSIRDKGDRWANNNWGWFWHTLSEDGGTSEFTLRMENGENLVCRFDDTRLTPGVWHHLAYVFDIDGDGDVRPSLYLDGEEQRVTSWSRGDVAHVEDMGHQGTPYAWRQENVVAVGGCLHDSGSVCGSVDNLMVWDRAICPGDVALAMGDISEADMPAGLLGSFGFDNEPEADHTFSGRGSLDFRAGALGYAATETEGQGVLRREEPEYTAGCPFLKGEAYAVSPRVELVNSGAILLSSDTTPSGGVATFMLPAEGIYELGVRAGNDYGTDERKARVRFGSGTALDSVYSGRQLAPAPNPFESYIDIAAPCDGPVRVSLYDLEGRRVLANDFNVSKGQNMRVYPQAGSGPHLLTLEGESTRLACKVFRR